MGGPFTSHSFVLPKPLLHLLLLLNAVTRAAALLRRRRPPPPPPPTSQPPTIQLSDNPLLVKSQLPVVDFHSLAGKSPATSPATSPAAACVVCLVAFEAWDPVRALGNCRHAFHVACIDRWIDADGQTCPLCRSPLLPAAADEAAARGIFVRVFGRIRIMSSSIHLFVSNLYVDNYL